MFFLEFCYKENKPENDLLWFLEIIDMLKLERNQNLLYQGSLFSSRETTVLCFHGAAKEHL